MKYLHFVLWWQEICPSNSIGRLWKVSKYVLILCKTKILRTLKMQHLNSRRVSNRVNFFNVFSTFISFTMVILTHRGMERAFTAQLRYYWDTMHVVTIYVILVSLYIESFSLQTLREKCPNTEFFLVRIFPHSDWIRRDTLYLSVFSPNARKYGQEKTPYLGTFHAVKVQAQKEIHTIKSHCGNTWPS